MSLHGTISSLKHDVRDALSEVERRDAVIAKIEHAYEALEHSKQLDTALTRKPNTLTLAKQLTTARMNGMTQHVRMCIFMSINFISTLLFVRMDWC